MNVTEIILCKFLNLPARNVTEKKSDAYISKNMKGGGCKFFVINHYFFLFLDTTLVNIYYLCTQVR